jgi:hypothetical protein
MTDSWTLGMKSKFDEIFERRQILSMPSFPGNARDFFGAPDYVFVIDAPGGLRCESGRPAS